MTNKLSRLAFSLICLQATASHALPVLTNAADLANAVYDNRTLDVDFAFDATFCEFRYEKCWIIFKDKTGSMTAEISPPIRELPLVPGDRIRISGKILPTYATSSPKSISPYLVHYIARCTNLVVIARDPPPVTLLVNGSEFISGRHDFSRVRLRGTVVDVLEDDVDLNAAHTVLNCDGHRILTAYPHARQSLNTLKEQIGCEIEVEGICNPAQPINRRRMGRVLERDADDPCVILRRKKADQFAVPDIRALLRKQPETLPQCGPHRAIGQVIAVSGGDTILFATETAITVKATLKNEPIPAFGEWVEVVGFPETDLYNLVLTRAQWRKAPRRQSRTDEPPTDKDIKTLAYENTYPNSSLRGKTIRVRGVIRSIPYPDKRSRRIILMQDNHILSVDITASATDPSLLKVGMTVEVVGNFILDTELWRPDNPLPRVREAFLAVRKPGDLKILANPPWWTPIRTMTLIGTLAFLLVGISVWNFMLRRLSERRGREITAATLAQAESELRAIERTKLAVELHDSLAQTLSGVAMELETAEQFTQGAREELVHHMKIAGLTLKSSRLELRNCLADLRSRALEEPTFDRAIQTALRPFITRIVVSVRFNVPRTIFTDNTVHAVLRIIRELVLNAIRHGQATKVKIAGSFECDTLRFSVTDNGCGFDPDAAPGVLQGHFGIQGIRERVRELDGRLTIDSQPGNGARITVTFHNPSDEETLK